MYFKFLKIHEIIFLLVQGRVRIIDVLVAGTGLLEETARALRSRVLRRSNSASSITSNISSISPRNITSFWLHVLGQNLRRPRTTGSVKVASFSKNCTTQ
ncbi:hypothetical protein ALC57_00231 [Trachymyrmex cornetzi]|uniref:Uncharacterized protein n=1 Tax=Trachymyrmex cornetzi TaxID=471704 RepID=A0A151JSG0_9HYME|nr:hypothetical protein ALC57_00231 [Trachymyrmex cornetzi]